MRFARNIVLYAIPESPDTIDDNLPEMLNKEYWDTILKHRLNDLKQRATTRNKDADNALTSEQMVDKCKQVVREGRTANGQRSIVGLYSKFDNLVLERFAGTAGYKKMLAEEAKDVYHFN